MFERLGSSTSVLLFSCFALSSLPTLAQTSPCTCSDSYNCGLQTFSDEITAFLDFDTDNSAIAYGDCVPSGYLDITSYDLFIDESQSHQFCGTYTTSSTETQIGVRQIVILRKYCYPVSVTYSLYASCGASDAVYVGQDINGGSRGFQYYFVTPNTTYRICRTITFNNTDSDCDYNSSCSSDPEFSAATLYVYTSGTVLPAEQLELNVSVQNEYPNLLWRLTDLSKVQQFEIERSVNGYEFQSIDTLWIPDLLKSASLYQYADLSSDLMEGGQYYYRIKSVSRAQDTRYSNQVSIIVPRSQKIALQVYPNPGTDLVHLQWRNQMNQPLKVSVHNQLGQQVWQQDLHAIEPKAMINVQEWQAGTYVLHAWNEHQSESLTFRVGL